MGIEYSGCIGDKRKNCMPLTHLPRATAGPLYLLLGCLLAAPLGSQAATSDDYLRQIETAAKQQASTPITTRSAPTPNIDATERLPLGLQQEDFEKTLREKFVGTYVFYERLTAQNKTRIFTLYQRDNRVSMIREQTLRLLSGTP